ncbi:hypothetical protein ABBQ38_004145 [Trebouxia sp. C0009 RCD-2024]
MLSCVHLAAKNYRLAVKCIFVQVGLLIGRSGNSGRSAVLVWLPTPHAPTALQSVEDKLSKTQKRLQQDMQLELAVESVVEHGVQVAAMLPGGVSVLGVYLYGPDAAFANASRQMCLMLDGITSGATTPADKLLFISSKSRKLLCKQHSAGTANAAALHVCEFKLGPMLPNFSIMTCRYQAIITLPVLDNAHQLSTHVEAAIAAESQRIQQSIGSIQGMPASGTTLVQDMQQPLVVELLSPPACCFAAEHRTTEEASVSGRVLLEGVLHGRAVVSKKDTLAAAVDFLKADLIGSLQARVDLLLAEADDLLSAGGTAALASSKPAMLTPPSSQPDAHITLRLPARVFFPVKQVLSFSDYLATGESFAEMSDRLQPLLASCVDLNQAEFPEGEHPSKQSATCVSKWDPRPKTGDAKGWLGSCSTATLVSTSLAVALAAGGVAFCALH